MTTPASVWAAQQTEITISSASVLNPSAVEVVFSNQQRMTLDFYGENIFRMFQDNQGGIVRDPQASPEAQILVDRPRKEVGELSLVIPEYVEELYPAVAAETPLKDTKLILEIVPGMAECDECDEIFNVVENEGYCPNCGSFEKTVLTGRDFNIKEIHVPE